MIPVDQIRTGVGRGQCTEASIAPILEVPLAEVPDLWNGFEGESTDWRDYRAPENIRGFQEWIKSRGYMWMAVLFRKRVPIAEAWVRACAMMPPELRSGFHLAAGPNPDGHSHILVCRDGVVVHDPNPLRRGIVACDEIGWLVPLAWVPDDLKHLPSAAWQADDPEEEQQT